MILPAPPLNARSQCIIDPFPREKHSLLVKVSGCICRAVHLAALQPLPLPQPCPSPAAAPPPPRSRCACAAATRASCTARRPALRACCGRGSTSRATCRPRRSACLCASRAWCRMCPSTRCPQRARCEGREVAWRWEVWASDVMAGGAGRCWQWMRSDASAPDRRRAGQPAMLSSLHLPALNSPQVRANLLFAMRMSPVEGRPGRARLQVRLPPLPLLLGCHRSVEAAPLLAAPNWLALPLLPPTDAQLAGPGTRHGAAAACQRHHRALVHASAAGPAAAARARPRLAG